jgi:hypothetical protein
MDDYNISSLHDSKNEFCCYLLINLTPLIYEGFKSIFNDSFELCKINKEPGKYLVNFQKLLSVIPKWNENTIINETKRIKNKSSYKNLEDLISCVHIIQTKLITMARVGHKQKKIDIPFPTLEKFIHDIYIESARKLYKNVYLFRTDISPLDIQKNNREIEKIIQECILLVIRNSIPVEHIVSAYMDETQEEGVEEEIKKEIIMSNTVHREPQPVELVQPEPEKPQQISFNDVDLFRNEHNEDIVVIAPKTDFNIDDLPAPPPEPEPTPTPAPAPAAPEIIFEPELNTDNLTNIDFSDFTTDEVFELPDL